MNRGVAIAAISLSATVISLSALFIFQSSFNTINGYNRTISSHISSRLSQQVLNLPNSNLTDDQLIQKGWDVPEVKVLYAKYPDDVNPYVDRSNYQTGSPYNELWVIYKVQKYVRNSTNGADELYGINLLVPFVPETNETKAVRIGCEGPGRSTPQQLSSVTTLTIANEMCFK